MRKRADEGDGPDLLKLLESINIEHRNERRLKVLLAARQTLIDTRNQPIEEARINILHHTVAHTSRLCHRPRRGELLSPRVNLLRRRARRRLELAAMHSPPRFRHRRVERGRK